MPEDKKQDTRPKLPALPPEMPEEEATRMQTVDDRTRDMPPVKTPIKDTRLIPPPPPKTVVPMPEKPKRGAPPKREIERKARTSSPLALPIWSVFLMLFMVGGTVACIVLAVLGLGGRRTPPTAPPQFVILTAAPSNTPDIELPSLIVSPTLPPEFQGSMATFVLEGPTLAPIIFTATPTPAPEITIGSVVQVIGTNGINLRAAPGTDQTRIDVADPGETFIVTGGPQQANALIWWEIRSSDNTITGWVAQNDGTNELLQVVSPS